MTETYPTEKLIEHFTQEEIDEITQGRSFPQHIPLEKALPVLKRINEMMALQEEKIALQGELDGLYMEALTEWEDNVLLQ